MNALISQGIQTLCQKYPSDAENPIMTDILLQACPSSGQFNIFNDDDELLYSTIIEQWTDVDNDDFYHLAAQQLRDCIIANNNKLEQLGILKPFSLLLIDEDKETVEELHLIDDQLLLLNSEELMKGLDEDLDAFFNRLMKP